MPEFGAFVDGAAFGELADDGVVGRQALRLAELVEVFHDPVVEFAPSAAQPTARARAHRKHVHPPAAPSPQYPHLNAEHYHCYSNVSVVRPFGRVSGIKTSPASPSRTMAL